MQVLFVRKKGKSVNQSNQSKVMVAVQVRDKNVGDFAAADFVFDHLYLCAFSAIHQVIGAVVRHHLAGGVAVECRNRGVISKDSDR